MLESIDGIGERNAFFMVLFSLFFVSGGLVEWVETMESKKATKR